MTNFTPTQEEKFECIEQLMDVLDAELLTDEFLGCDYELVRRWRINREWWDTPTEVDVVSKDGEEITVSVGPEPASTGAGDIKAPIEWWTVDQRVDDLNLLTSLKLTDGRPVSGGLSVSGPEAQYDMGSIKLPHVENEDDYLI